MSSLRVTINQFTHFKDYIKNTHSHQLSYLSNNVDVSIMVD